MRHHPIDTSPRGFLDSKIRVKIVKWTSLAACPRKEVPGLR